MIFAHQKYMKNTRSSIRLFMGILSLFVSCLAIQAQEQISDKDALLFYLSGEQGTEADFAQGNPTPNFLYNVSTIDQRYRPRV